MGSLMEQNGEQSKADNAGLSFPQNTGYVQRWYDMDVQLGELVRMLETLSEESQTLFAFLMGFFSDQIVKVRGRAFFAEMEWDKLIGIYKSRKGRRWYDQHAVLHKAFNKLYSLNDDDKAAIARQLYVPGRIVRHYEDHCAQKRMLPQIEVICRIVQTSFQEGPQVAEERFQTFD